jgi:putative endonuclease
MPNQVVHDSRSGQSFFMLSKTYFVYILASKRNGTIYTGVTSDLIKRVYQHKNGLIDGFTKKYSVHDLVYFEATDDVQSALQREKQIKKWNRQWKIEMIEKKNNEWRDLYPELTGDKDGFPPYFDRLSTSRGNDRKEQ